MNKQNQLLFFFACFILFKSNALPPKYEFRGVWVATVNNIDWPSSPDLTSDEQILEIKNIVSKNHDLGLNAIVLQVRPTCDVFYQSVHEPWSKYLTGTQGKSPKPFYNPLQIWINECHKKGMELHAWINPYRVSQDSTDILSENHPATKNPEWVITYGKKRFFNPGIPEVRSHILSIVKELTQNYDIDGIHMDDYFYPYPIQGIEFPDSTTYFKYGIPQGWTNVEDWRRNNVNITVKSIYATIKETKPWVRFGISPFGVWRNKVDDINGSDTNAGLTNYDDLYADVRFWIQKGWVDYVTPQLYWRHSHPLVAYPTLAKWWNDNAFGKDIYIGHALYKINNSHEDWTNPNQVPSQIELTRNFPNIKGSIFFSSRHFDRDLLGLQKSLSDNLYKTSAIPTISNKEVTNYNVPKKVKKRGKKIKWSLSENTENIKNFILYYWPENEEPDLNNPEHIYTITKSNIIKIDKNRLRKKHKRYVFAITTLNKYNCESITSEPIIFRH